MVVPLVDLLASCRETLLPSDYARGTRPTHGIVLDWRGDAFLHLLDHAGVLLNADLSSYGPADWIGSLVRELTESSRVSCAASHLYNSVCRARDPCVDGVAHTRRR